MSIIKERSKRFAANSIFPSFFLGWFGLGLAQAWAAQMGGSWRVHAVLGIPGIVLSAVAFYRARLHGLAGVADLTFGIRDFAWYALLFGTGIVIALSTGSALLLGIAAALTYMVPWAKIPVCRTRFIASAITVLAGAMVWLSLYGKPAYPLHYALAAWIVLIPPMMMLLFVIVSLPAGYRMRESTQVKRPESDTHLPFPQ